MTEIKVGNKVYLKKTGVGSDKPLYEIKNIALQTDTSSDLGVDRYSLHCVVTLVSDKGEKIIAAPNQIVVSI